ncbi:MAG: hypothetical protein KGJ10_01875 [Acidobacteriota bacterium]|nr:hypothetical protein [Acidobacteriota bacterium]MDE3043559.1 hypothetical protein [Acidobacteriota bacterium]MDE3106908.1 hypothetical protein [Acidobacteriota bacterium]MDE3222565.1 hypothetical protein [Acidobacteriota bacterium]
MRTLLLGYCALVVVYGALLAAMIGLAGWTSDNSSTASSRAKSWVQFGVLIPGALTCCLALGFLDAHLSTTVSLVIAGAALIVGIAVVVVEASVDDRLTKSRH